MVNDEYAIPGYFVDSTDAEGRITPYREIHEPVRSNIDSSYGFDTAFSFFRDLRYLLWGIYFVSHHLREAILSLNGLAQASEYKLHGKTDDLVIKIAKRISSLPLRFYSDEAEKDLPYVEVVVNKAETILKLSYPYEGLLIGMHGKHNSLVPFIGDGISRTYRFPYWRGKL